MADIKTRDAVKGTIKTLDKAAVASERMKSAYAKTKEKRKKVIFRGKLPVRICGKPSLVLCRACHERRHPPV